jgi:hypothetical protein
MFWSAGCSLLRAEGFSCSLLVLYYIIFWIFGHQTLDPEKKFWLRIRSCIKSMRIRNPVKDAHSFLLSSYLGPTPAPPSIPCQLIQRLWLPPSLSLTLSSHCRAHVRLYFLAGRLLQLKAVHVITKTYPKIYLCLLACLNGAIKPC